MLKKYTSGFLATCFLVTSFGAAASEEENIIKYRDRIMDASKYHISATGMILKGEVTFNEDLLMHAKALKDLLSDVTKYFPEGSDLVKPKPSGISGRSRRNSSKKRKKLLLRLRLI